MYPRVFFFFFTAVALILKDAAAGRRRWIISLPCSVLSIKLAVRRAVPTIDEVSRSIQLFRSFLSIGVNQIQINRDSQRSESAERMNRDSKRRFI